MARLYETFTVFSLLGMVVVGLTYVISALIDKDNSSIQTLLSKQLNSIDYDLKDINKFMFIDFWSYYLPFLYSCISFLGVLLLLVCTPLGFVRLFDVVGQFLIKPQFLRDLNEEYFACALEEESLRRRLKHAQFTGKTYLTPAPMAMDLNNPLHQDEYNLPNGLLQLRNGKLQTGLGSRLSEIEMRRKLLGI